MSSSAGVTGHLNGRAEEGWDLFTAGWRRDQVLSASKVPAYDAGQSGQVEQTLHRLGVTTPPAESVLIQARPRVRPPGGTSASGARLRHAAAQPAALRALPGTAADIRSPLSPGGSSLISADGRSALVTFKLAGNADNEDNLVVPALHAVAAVQARHRALRIEEAGDASADRGHQRPGE